MVSFSLRKIKYYERDSIRHFGLIAGEDTGVVSPGTEIDGEGIVEVVGGVVVAEGPAFELSLLHLAARTIAKIMIANGELKLFLNSATRCKSFNTTIVMWLPGYTVCPQSFSEMLHL